MNDTIMSNRQVLESKTIADRLKSIPGWKFHDNRLVRDFQLKDFKSAFALMTQIALKAEQMDHHPDWKNVYNRLHIELQTHDAGGVTGLDLELAAFAEESFARFSR